MKLPKQNELIQVFNYDYTDGKLRHFKEKILIQNPPFVFIQMDK